MKSIFYKIKNDCARLRVWHGAGDVVKITGDKSFDLDLPACRSTLLARGLDRVGFTVLSVGKTEIDHKSWESSVKYFYKDSENCSAKQAVIFCMDWELAEALRESLVHWQLYKDQIARNIAELTRPYQAVND